MISFTRILFITIFFSALSSYAAETPEILNRVTCTSGKDSRELEIMGKDGGNVVTYTKGGVVKEVGSCSMKKEKCQVIFDGIKKNLEKSGYACQI